MLPDVDCVLVGCNHFMCIISALVHICGKRTYEAQVDSENIIHPSPYPVPYANTLNCWYTVTAPSNTKIRFWIDDFGTERFDSALFYLWVSRTTVEPRCGLRQYQAMLKPKSQ